MAYDQINQLYNFNDKTDQFELSAAKLTLNHDPDPVGAARRLHLRPHQRPDQQRSAQHDDNHLCRISASLPRAGIPQPEAAQGQGLRAGLRQIRHLGRSGSHRGEEQLELLALAAVCERDSLLALRRPHLDARFERPKPSASSWSTAGTTSPSRNGGVYRRVYQRSCKAEVHLDSTIWSGPKTPTPPADFAT